MATAPEWCAGIKPTDPNDEGPQTPVVIRPLHRLVGARLHCWLSFALITLVFVFNWCRQLLASLVLRRKIDDDYKGLKGFMPFYMKWFYGPISDGWNRPIRGPPGKYIEVIPRKRFVQDRVRVAHVPDLDAPTQRCLNLGSYNYLGYGGVFPGITEHLIDCVDRSGLVVSTTPAELGISAEQRKAEEAIARFIGKEDAVSFPMGFATNSMVIPALIGREGLVISDELNHASIITGVRRTGAAVRVFRHNDMAHLEQLLQAATSPSEAGRWSRILIVVEGLYSMEGELCPLRDIVELKHRYGALLYIDEAHSIGALGATGRGICEYYGVSPRHVDVLMGTFTKSFSSIGGYIASDRDVVAMLRRKAPGWMYGQSMSPPCAEQVVRALAHLQTPAGRELIRKLRENSITFRRALTERRCSLLGPPDTPVVPQMVRHPAKLSVFSRMLMKQGIASVIVGYPATPVTGLRARFCISGALDRDEVVESAARIADVSRDLCIDFLTPSQAREALEQFDATLAASSSKVEQADVAFVDASSRPYTSLPIAPAGYADKPARIIDASAARADGKEPVVLSAQDYLGLANCKEALDAAKETIRSYGCGACGPRGFYGTTDKHLELEERIARFVGAEAAILYSYGALVPTSVLSPYANDPADTVFYDEAIGHSAQVGVSLCRAKSFAFPHNDAAALGRLMTTVCACAEFRNGRKYIFTEGVFTNSGDVAPLPELVRLKKKFGASLVIDETHSIGTLGSTGRGLRELWAERTGDASLMDRATVDFIVGSLETSFGSIGGFCCGSRPLIQYQLLCGIGYVFSASEPPYLCSAATAAIDALEARSADLIPALRRNVAHARAAAVKKLGAMYDISGTDAESPVMMLSLRRRGASWATREEDEALLEKIAAACAEEDNVAVCQSAHIESDTGAPERPSLRICVSAKYDADSYDSAFSAIAHHTEAVLAQ